jgi:ABC-type glycerol-3-phosphate transport system permease component
MIRDTTVGAKLWNTAVWAVVGFFVLNLLALIATVVTSSFATRWLGTWLPAGWTTRWYTAAWDEFQLGDVLLVTFQIVFLVVALSGLLGVPAAYALARRDFPGKSSSCCSSSCRCSFRRSPSASRSRPCSTGRASPARCPGWFWRTSSRPCPS